MTNAYRKPPNVPMIEAQDASAMSPIPNPKYQLIYQREPSCNHMTKKLKFRLQLTLIAIGFLIIACLFFGIWRVSMLQSHEMVAERNIEMLSLEINNYRDDNGVYPTSLDFLQTNLSLLSKDDFRSALSYRFQDTYTYAAKTNGFSITVTPPQSSVFITNTISKSFIWRRHITP